MDQKKLAIIATKGSLDWAYPPFILASTASALGYEKMASKGVASLEELRELCQEAEVRLIACQMTVDLFDMDPTAFVEGIEFAGAARFFEFAGQSDICLYI